MKKTKHDIICSSCGSIYSLMVTEAAYENIILQECPICSSW